MGGDHGPEVVVPAALQVLGTHEDVKIIFVGNEAVLAPLLNQPKAIALKARWRVHHATEVVEMDELPSQAMRNKKDSSMRVALDLVKSEVAQACVSAGNTGALMATARFVLKTLPGIDRPAIVTRFPTRDDHQSVYVLDLGANVDSSAEVLAQFAVMGSVLASASGIANPRVGLLNIGEEEIKGNDQVKRTAELLAQNTAIHYIGYVEGDGIFSADADVVVCDGFVGNIALKACEGIAKLMGAFIKEAFTQNILTRLAAWVVLPVLKRLQAKMDPRRRNGAILIGLNGIVIKSHGSAGVVAFSSAIEEAVSEIEKNVPQRIREQVSRILDSESEKE